MSLIAINRGSTVATSAGEAISKRSYQQEEELSAGGAISRRNYQQEEELAAGEELSAAGGASYQKEELAISRRGAISRR